MAGSRFFLGGMRGYHVEPPHQSGFVGAPAIVVSTPLRSDDGKLLGVLIGWIGLQGLNAIAGQRSGLHSSDDVYLVDPDFKFVTQPRFVDGPAVLTRQVRTEAVKRCLAGNSGVALSPDYRGVPSITVYRWLPRHKLGLITKMSQDEAYLLVRDFRQALLIIGALTLLASSAVAVAFARTITHPILALQQAVERFGRGGDPIAVQINTRDELGQLAWEFKRMSAGIIDKEAQLRANAAELEQRVRDRTQVLQRQADLLDLAHDAIIVLDRQDVITYWSQGAQEMYGWQRDEAIGQHVAAVLDGGPPGMPAPGAGGPREPGRWEGRLIHTRRDGKRIIVASRQVTHVDADTQAIVTLIINTDITEHSLAQEELTRFFDLSLDLLCIASMDGYLKRLNPAWEKALGHSLEELRSRPYLEFVHPDDRAATSREASDHPDGKLTRAFENRFRCNDGSYRWLSWQAVPAVDARLVYAVARDVTDSKRAQLELARAKEAAESANHAKSAFLANMSHEIRTPMNGVIGLAALLMKTALTPQQREYMQMLKSSADALLRLLNDILDFSKMEEGRLELDVAAFDLREAVGDTLKAFSAVASEKRLELTCHIAADVPKWLIGDAGRLAQIIINLVGNALKFTHDGEVVVRVGHRATAAGASELAFSVTDTGIGMTPEQQTHIFKEFAQAENSTRRRYGGTGLGLAIVSQLVALMGGAVRVESEPGRGTTFHFTIRLEAVPEQPGAPFEALPGTLKNIHVLVVDDNRTNRLILGEILGSWRMRPTLAQDGADALAQHRRAHAAGAPFALILLDAQMPDADGFDLAAKMRALPGGDDAIIMMLSSSDAANEIARCHQLGIECFLRKPIKQSELFDAIIMAAGSGSHQAGRVSEGARAGVPAPSVSLKVLVAEDHPINQALVTEILRARGHLFSLAANGKEAIALWERTRFDVILIDGQMPEMDGYEATREIRRRERGTGRHIRIVALTANAMLEDRATCLAAGMDGYISKPIDPDQLLMYLELAERPAPAGGPARPSGAATARFVHFDLGQAQARSRGKAALLTKMVRMFTAGLPGLLGAAQAGVDAMDAVGVERAAHRLRGAAATLAAQALADACDVLETQGRQAQFAAMAAALAEVRRLAEALRGELTTFLGE